MEPSGTLTILMSTGGAFGFDVEQGELLGLVNQMKLNGFIYYKFNDGSETLIMAKEIIGFLYRPKGSEKSSVNISTHGRMN